MPSSYTTNLGIEKPATGEQSGTWGDTVNLNYDLFDQAINGVQSVTLAAAGSSGSPRVLAITDGTVSEGRNKFIEFVDGGDLGATAYVQLTPNDAEKIVHFRNSLSANRSVIVFQGTYNASNDFEIPNGKDVVLKFDGAGSGAVVEDVFVDLQVTGLTAGTADINGGTLDGVVIGGASAAAATVTDLTASGTVDFNGATVSDLGTVTTADINGGTIDGVTIGGSTPAVGTFTTLTASGDAAITSGSGTPLAISGASPGDRALITSSDGTITGVFGASPPESNVRIGSQSNHALSVVVNNVEVGSFTTSGNFGIGTTTPVEAFQVVGNSQFGDAGGGTYPSNTDIAVYRALGARPVIRLLDDTNDSFIEGGQTLRFGTFNSLGTTVDMELDANGNLILSGGRFQSGTASFTVSAAGTTTHVSGQFSAGSYLLDFRVAGLNMEIKLTAVLHVANNLTPAFSVLQTSDFNVGSVALQCEDNVAQFGFDNARERKIQFVCTGDGSADRTAVYRWVKIND